MTAVALAVDLGGTKLESALVDDAGQVLPGSVQRRLTGPGITAEGAVQALTDAIHATLAAHPTVRPIGVGIGAAGPIELSEGAIAPVNLLALARFPIVDAVRAIAPGIPVALRLDGTCIALAEHLYGAARGTQHSLSMVVSTGVGGGLVIGGRLLSGASGNAGHIGQLRIRTRDVDGPSDAGTVEDIASGPRSVAWARANGWDGTTGEQLAAAYAAGNEIAIAAARRSADAVGQAIALVSTLLDIEVAVLAGGFVAVTPDYFDLVHDAVQFSALLPYARQVRIAPSGLAGAGPLIGAAALIHHPELLDA